MAKTSTFQQRFLEIIESTGKTDAVLADELGVSKQAFSSWRTGKRSPTRSMIEKIADQYNVDVAWLMGYDASTVNMIKHMGSISSYKSLTPEESRLLSLFRGADERAREDAIATLEKYQTVTEKKSLG